MISKVEKCPEGSFSQNDKDWYKVIVYCSEMQEAVKQDCLGVFLSALIYNWIGLHPDTKQVAEDCLKLVKLVIEHRPEKFEDVNGAFCLWFSMKGNRVVSDNPYPTSQGGD